MNRTRLSPSDGQLFGLLVAGCVVIFYWKFFLILFGVIVACVAFSCWGDSLRERVAARRADEQRLIENANIEHRLVQRGDLGGIYGAYPVPDECRGIGIWLCGPEPKARTGKRRRGEPQRRSA